MMRTETDAYAAQHAETNLANKMKVEDLQEARRKKKALVRSQIAQLSDVTRISVFVPELLESKQGPVSDLTQESEKCGPPKRDREQQPEKNTVHKQGCVRR